MRNTRIECDNCGSEAAEGFQLDNIAERTGHNVRAHLERPVQFCKLNCVAEWAAKAEEEAKGMIQHARSLHPHGTFYSELAPGLVVY